MIGLSPRYRRLKKHLDALAANGCFSLQDLHVIKSQAGVVKDKQLSYYLASLYLQLGESHCARELLSHHTVASREMKKFCHVLNYCRKNNLSMPTLSVDEINCLDYLDRVINPLELSIDHVISQYKGILICGNAPGDTPIECPDSWCSIYFNDYKKNPAISGTATIHVVTPSWNEYVDRPSRYRCITGNEIFYRRSSVWKRFITDSGYLAIYTAPRALWSSLFSELQSSPSAGLLMMSYIAEIIRQSEIDMPIIVAGFSGGQSTVNHSYDSTPASDRHNWVGEQVVFGRLLSELKKYNVNVAVQS